MYVGCEGGGQGGMQSTVLLYVIHDTAASLSQQNLNSFHVVCSVGCVHVQRRIGVVATVCACRSWSSCHLLCAGGILSLQTDVITVMMLWDPSLCRWDTFTINRHHNSDDVMGSFSLQVGYLHY